MEGEYTLKAFGANLNMRGRPKWYTVVAFFIGVAILAYLISALVLYASVQLYPWVDFSWVNVLWFVIVLIAAHYVFGKSD